MRGAGAMAACLLAGAIVAAAQAPEPQRLTGGDRLRAAYDAAFDADFTEAARRREAACPPAPEPACLLLDALITWWQIQLDPADPQHDDTFERRVNLAIETASAWTEAEPTRAEAWFYLGAGHGARAQWKALRGERLGAAREGRTIKDALDRALALEPRLDDARLGLGLYQYYAGTAPAVWRVLRWLFFLPGGDRNAGLARIEASYQAGGLVSAEAAFQLQQIYLWYEERFQEARGLVETLAKDYPHSPLFPQLLATIDDVYLNDPAESRRGWEVLLADAREGRMNAPHIAEARALLALGVHLDRLHESDEAIVYFDAALQLPRLPYGLEADASLQRGRSYDRLGERAQAQADYDRATAAAPPDDPSGIRVAAARAPSEAPSPARARAYRLALEGWRALGRGELAHAWERLDTAWSIDPRNPVTRYRRARVLLARSEAGEAFAELDGVLAMRPPPPPATRIAACLDAAALAERFDQPARARALYVQASQVHGADTRLRERAARAAARLAPDAR